MNKSLKNRLAELEQTLAASTPIDRYVFIPVDASETAYFNYQPLWEGIFTSIHSYPNTYYYDDIDKCKEWLKSKEGLSVIYKIVSPEDYQKFKERISEQC